MAKTETLHIRVNETVKENAEETLELFIKKGTKTFVSGVFMI